MDSLDKNRQILLKVLEDYLDRRKNNPPTGVETQGIFDTKNDHYEIKKLGWRNERRIYFTVFHFDLMPDGKIWVQANASDYDIIGDIEAAGVPKSEIVLAFHAPSIRPYSGYAAA